MLTAVKKPHGQPRNAMRKTQPNNGKTTINVRGVSSPRTPRTPIHAHEIFLNICRKEYASVEVVTKSGEIINGVIDCYDKDTIVLHNDMTQLLIYKHSINYISPRNGKRLVIPEGQMNQIPDEESLMIEE